MSIPNESSTLPTSQPRQTTPTWILILPLALILLAGAYFRFSGLLWGEYTFLHPDERFLIWVASDIHSVESLGQYFDTSTSPLNPHNAGHGYYVYGTLPMFITRYVAEWTVKNITWETVTQVGRSLSSIADLLTILLIYLVAQRLYDRRVALLAAAFSAAVVLQIQQSHFFTMDTFINAFSLLAFYVATRIAAIQLPPSASEEQGAPASTRTTIQRYLHNPLLLLSIAFGIALGMAIASKLNAAAMCITLPLALAIVWFRLPASQRAERSGEFTIYIFAAAFMTLLSFRIFQPYAFSGPGFFGLLPNPQWVANIRELIAQSGGDVDFPPAMQWARRPIWFSFQNMVTWGLGLPLGILAWAGFAWAGWRLFTGWRRYPGEWQRHALIWGWTAIYFAWQSSVLNPTMRYQLPIYPSLAIFAAWFIIALWDKAKTSQPCAKTWSWPRLAVVALAGATLIATYAYAFAFSQIYTRPITRVAASRWIYENIPGPINLRIQTAQETINQIIPFPYQLNIIPGIPYSYNFEPQAAGTLSQVVLPRVTDTQGNHESRTLQISITNLENTSAPLAAAAITDDMSPTSQPDGSLLGKTYIFDLDHPVSLLPDHRYSLLIQLGANPAEKTQGENLIGELLTGILPQSDIALSAIEQPLENPRVSIQINAPLQTSFTTELDGYLTHFVLKNAIPDPAQISDIKNFPAFRITLQNPGAANNIYQAQVSLAVQPDQSGYIFLLPQPLQVMRGQVYNLTLEVLPQGGSITLSGMGLANEGDWDDGLPVRLDGYDGFGGIYVPELNFNMYWDDNTEKLARFQRILNQADYLVISSNRQWGTLPRIPERFPMTSNYYRALLGCPNQLTIEYCYRIAQPGLFQEQLGYHLIKVFESPPTLGMFSLNDQFAEEAFTVYDHPKVFIFKKSPTYDASRVETILGATDFSMIVRTPPMRAEEHPANLLLPTDRLEQQRMGGTWSDFFNPNALHNRFQPLGVLLWYLSVGLLGLFTYPLLRLALPGLHDGGYPLARTAGMLILSYLVWLAGSLEVPFSRLTIGAALLLIASLGICLAYIQRLELRQEWRQRRTYFLIVEGLFLVLFLAFLLIRLGNPDLWHPWKGGEKPMDFSYFNAVLKSTSFPPYDPWFAGGYLNYYYYGFVFVGVLVKWLGILPSFAYNLILPTLFSLIAMGAFSVTWNLGHALRQHPTDRQETTPSFDLMNDLQPALAAALGVAVLGNLGTIRMIFQGWQRLAAPDGVIDNASLLTRWGWAANGFVKMLQGAHLPYGVGDWYWIPSRAIPAPNDVEPITEFPYFSLLYADLHAHLIAIPITLLALTGIVSILLSQGRWSRPAAAEHPVWPWLGGAFGFLITGLAVGALRPTNTWDFYPYLVLGSLVIAYTFWVYHPTQKNLPPELAPYLTQPTYQKIIRLVTASGAALLFITLAYSLFTPFANWYAQGYSKIRPWDGTLTSVSAYLTHWGLFLFIIITWMTQETIDWMAHTPASALRKLRPYHWVLWTLFGLLALLILFLLLPRLHIGQLGLNSVPTDRMSLRGLLMFSRAPIAWLALPIAAWAAVLLLRPHQPDAKRFVLFLIGTGLTLTLMVEVIVLVGDIGRMNTVFKFYLQVWIMFAVSAAAALGWLLPKLSAWRPNLRRTWQTILTILVLGAALYTLWATMAKIQDRMTAEAPHTLDGMVYMEYSSYADEWGTMDLSQDYRAIRWLQDNVYGSPVIVEANLRNLYRWGSRYSIYTGLPGVVGWEWHQQQQRAVNSGSWISSRITEIDAFYQTIDLQSAVDFLRKYQVQYIIVGQQERGHYPGPGLEKFPDLNGLYWIEVYRDAETVIYQVNLED